MRLAPMLAALGIGLAVAACSNSAAAPVNRTWTNAGVSFRYPDTLSPGPIALAAVVPAGDCLCHVISTPGGVMWQDIRTDSLRYRGDNEAGMEVRIIDVSRDVAFSPAVSEPSAGVMDAVNAQLGVSVSAVDTGYTLTGATAVAMSVLRSDELAVTGESGRSLQQQDWAVIDSAAGRLYVFVCQYSAAQRTDLLRICRDALASLTVSTD